MTTPQTPAHGLRQHVPLVVPHLSLATVSNYPSFSQSIVQEIFPSRRNDLILVVTVLHERRFQARQHSSVIFTYP
jgi:hypothetical protein